MSTPQIGAAFAWLARVQKRCVICGQSFDAWSPYAEVCSVACRFVDALKKYVKGRGDADALVSLIEDHRVRVRDDELPADAQAAILRLSGESALTYGEAVHALRRSFAAKAGGRDGDAPP